MNNIKMSSTGLIENC